MSQSRAGASLRAEAAGAVNAVRVQGRSLDAALVAAEERIASGDRPLLRHLCFETLRHHWHIRTRISALLSKPLARRDSLIEDLLAVGIAQLDYSRVAPHAAVSLTVEAVRMLRKPKFAGLVNAILRRHQRDPATEGNDEARYDHPQWMLKRLQRDWPDDWQSIVSANNDRAPMWLRINTRRTTAADWLANYETTLTDGEALPAELPGLDAALCLDVARGVDAIPGFAEGQVSVQDGAAQIAAPWLLHDGGQRILDACAAPGGKTAHLSELAAADAALTAIDSDADRLLRVSETLSRIGGHATVLAGDASKPEEWWDGRPFDRILLDAPCSASGVIRRHPDIRLLRRNSDIASLAAEQLGLLTALWPLLATGGRLLYVTCSVFAEENDGVVSTFLGGQTDASEEPLLPNNNIRAVMQQKATGWQVLPGTAQLDGFYFASLRKAPLTDS